VILVTVGTHEAPFDRLLTAVCALAPDEELVVQHGPSRIRPPGATCVAYLAYDELVELAGRARVVVCHAGVGSIMTALACGKRPVVVPRLRRHAEHVDDHQLELARRLDREGLVVLVEREHDLADAVARRGDDEAPSFSRPGRLAREVHTLLQSRLEAAR
jgi:UDP-N-acetylglucosamine transferase subunit ALG13